MAILQCRNMKQQQTSNAINACLQLGDKLITPKLSGYSPLQAFYGRDKRFTLQLIEKEEGRQFLRLAIALVASIGVNRTAVVLAQVFGDQEDPKSYVNWSSYLPTNEFRAKRQFRLLVSDWQIHQGRRGYHGPACNFDISTVLADTCPDDESLVLLINAICKVVKDGGAATIFAASCWPWAMGLLEWLLGPPLGANYGKHRFRCRISIIPEEHNCSQLKSLCVEYRK